MNTKEQPCGRCDHPSSWHRHDDADNHDASDPACPFRCIGYDCERDGFGDAMHHATCTCPDFEVKHG